MDKLMRHHALLEQNIIENLIKSKSKIAIYLINGISLKGHIIAFDDCSIILKPDETLSNDNQLIIKQVISTIMLTSIK